MSEENLFKVPLERVMTPTSTIKHKKNDAKMMLMTKARRNVLRKRAVNRRLAGRLTSRAEVNRRSRHVFCMVTSLDLLKVRQGMAVRYLDGFIQTWISQP